MGYVTHSTTEQFVDGEPISTETLHFESYEDFKDWEKGSELSVFDFTVPHESETGYIKKTIPVVTEPEWIEHDGSDICPVPNGVRHEIMFDDGETVEDDSPETWSWGCKEKLAHIIKYRIV